MSLARELAQQADFTGIKEEKQTLDLSILYSDLCLVRIIGFGSFVNSSDTGYIVEATLSKLIIATAYDGMELRQAYNRLDGLRVGQEGRSKTGFKLDLTSINPHFVLGLATKQEQKEGQRTRRTNRESASLKTEMQIYILVKNQKGETLFNSGFGDPRQARKFLRKMGLTSKQAIKSPATGGEKWELEVISWDRAKAIQSQENP